MNWQPPSYDRHQFADRRAKAVHATYSPDGWNTTGIAFTDLQASMHVHRREAVQERRLPTPEWVNNVDAFREEVLKFCEKRYYLGPRNQAHVPGLTSQERFARIKQIERMHLKRWLVVLQRLRERYRTEPEETRPEERQLQNVDTQCCLLKRGSVAITVAVVYFYYHLGWDSVAVAQELHLKPPHVRQILARLLHSASGIPQVPYSQRIRGPRAKWATPPSSGPDFELMLQWHSERMPLDELTTRLRILGYDPLRLSDVYKALENAKLAHFQKLQEQVASAEFIFSRIPLKKPRSAEHRRKLSEGHKARWMDPAFREKTIAGMRRHGKGTRRSPYRSVEHRAKLSVAAKASYASGKRSRTITPETRSKQSESLRARHAATTPERRAEINANIKASWIRRRAEGKVPKPHTPESIARARQGIAAAWARGAYAKRPKQKVA